MKKLFTLCFLMALVCVKGWGQSSANYAFTTGTTGSLASDINSNIIDMTTGTTQLVGAGADATISAVNSIGFTYYFMGKPYTQFSASADGYVGLGATAVSGTDMSSASATTPKIAAMGGDLYTAATNGQVQYKLVGTAPNRCLVVQFTNMAVFYTTTASNAINTYQVRLYESNGILEFVYGTMYCGVTTYGPGYVGFSTGAAANLQASVTTSTNSVTTNSTTFNSNFYSGATNIANLNSSSNPNRRYYRFTPPAITATDPTSISFTSVGISTTTLNWVDNSTVESIFTITRATDAAFTQNVVTSTVASTTTATTGTAYNQVQTGLSANTIYYYKVQAGNEGLAPSSGLTGSQATASCPSYSGTITVGATGTFTNLTAAISNLTSCSYTGNIILELQSNYTSSAETFPITFPSGLGASGKAITIRPAAGVSPTITSANTTGTILLNGADYITFDGRPGGTGVPKTLVISNTSTTGYVIKLDNDATFNTIQYCTVTGVNSGSTGDIWFGSTAATTGNDNNLIDNNDILSGATNPAISIYSSGNSTALDNSTNTISNNNIADYFSASLSSYGVQLSSTGNSGWTISSNRFYQTSTKLYTSGSTHNAINVQTGSGYTISGNIIGYANSGGTGTTNMVGNSVALSGTFPSSYTTTGSATATRFIGINCAFTAGGANSIIQSNTIAGFALYTSSGATTTNGIFCGIDVTSGNATIGGTSTGLGNTIGAAIGVGSIYAATTTSGGAIVGIYANGSNTITIQNNTIGAVDAMGTTASINGSITGINTGTGSGIFSILGNVVGNSTNPNLRMGNLTTGANLSNTGTTFGTATGSGLFYGISTGGTGTIGIGSSTSPNTIQNASLNSSSSSAAFRGIYNSSGATLTVTGNTITNITSPTTNITFTSGSVAGIGIYISTGITPIVTGNTISGLSLTANGTGAYSVTGITYTAPTTSITISKNKIYGLSNAGTSTSATAPAAAAGIFIRDGSGATTEISNNMISLGNSQTTNTSFIGIWAQYTLSTATILKTYYNSVNIEGTVSSGAQPSFGFLKGDFSTIAANNYTVDIKNNIFSNTRNGGTGKHYAIANNYGATASATGWGANASNYNVLNGTAANIGYWNADKTFAAWQTASSGDGSSYSGITVTFNNTATGDLHLNMGATATPLESGGTVIASVNTDYDSDPRFGNLSYTGSGTAPDLGADEFAGTPVGASITLGSNNIAAGNITGGTVNNPVYSFSIASVGANATLTGLNITTTGTYASADITNLKVWYSASATFTTAGSALLSSLATPGAAGTKTFPSFSQGIGSGATGYIYVTADLSCAAIGGNTIAVNAVTPANTTFTSGTVSGTPAAGNTQTIVAATANAVSNLTASIANQSSVLAWTAPTGCYDEVLIVASAGSANTGTPTGNGTAYIGNLAFGSGTALGNGFVVYKGIATPETVTALTNGTTYYFKVYTRLGTTWVSGNETNAVPNLIYCTPSGGSSSTTYYLNAISSTNGITNLNYTASSFSGYVNNSASTFSQYSGSNVNLSLGASGGSTYHWYCWIDWNSDGDFDDAGETIFATTVYTSSPYTSGIIAVPSGQAVGNYRVRFAVTFSGTLTSCGSAASGNYVDYTINVVGTPTWTGTVSTDWNTPGNWSNNAVPTASTPTVIAAATNQPVIGTSTAALAASVTLNAVTTLTINGTLNDGGNWTNNSSATAVSGTGTVTMSGGTATIGGTASTSFPNLTTTGTITMGVATTVTGAFSETAGTFAQTNVSLTVGSFSLSGNGTFNFAPTGATSATVVNITGTGGFTQTGGTIYTTANVVNGIFNFAGTGTIASPQILNNTVSGTSSNTYFSYSINSGTVVSLSSNLTLYGTSATIGYSSDVVVNGTLVTGTRTISNNSGTTATSTFKLNSGATLYTANAIGVYGLSASVSSTNITPTFDPAANYVFNGTSSQTTNFNGTTAAAMANLTISNSAGVTNNAANTVSGILTLTNGILKTTTGSTLTLTNTAVGAVSGGSANSYIAGPLNRTLPASLSSSTNVYLFPVGNLTGTAYYPYSITTVNTGATAPVLQVLATTTTTAVGAPNNTTLSALSATEYWTTTVVSGNYSGASLSIGRSTPTTLSPLNAIGASTILAGPYNSLSGTVGTLSSTTSVNSSNQTGITYPLYTTLATTASYTVTYNANGSVSGTAPVDAGSPYAYNATVTVLGNTGTLVKTGYTFTGWNTLSNGSGTAYAPGATFSITTNTTLYAQYSINSYTLTYTGNTSTGGTAPTAVTQNYNTTIAVAGQGTLVKTGYTFNGWNTAADGTGTAYAVGSTFTFTANTTLYAQWTIASYTLSYNGNGNTGGTAPSSVTQTYNTTTIVSTPGALVKIGYTFTGWNTAPDGTGTPYPIGSTFTFTANTTLYAQWSINSYTLTYDGNTNTGGTAPASVTKNYNTTTTVSGAGTLVKTGYTFTGWNTVADGTGTAYAPGDAFTFTTNITLYAQWTINTYTLTYDGNTNTGGTAPTSVTQNYNTTTTVAGQVSLVKTGYTFSGWNTVADGSGTAYAPGDAFTFTANTTLYAQWTIIPYTITSSAGANGAISPNGTTTVNYGDDATYTVTPATGYHVDVLTVDGSTVPSATTYTFTNVTADHTISVTFSINTYTITSSAGSNGTISPNGTATVNYGGSQTYIITPGNSNYSIQQVLVDGTNDPTAVSTGTYIFSNVTANHTIVASFYLSSCPNPATANAGPDGSVCSNVSDTLAGTIGGGATTATWTTSGSGTFSPNATYSNTGTTTYTPSAADSAAGSVFIILTTNNPNASVCQPAKDTLLLTINPLPTATVAANSPYACLGTGGSFTITGTPNSTVFYNIDVSPSTGSVTLDASGSGTVPLGFIATTRTIILTSVSASGTGCTGTPSGAGSTATIATAPLPVAEDLTGGGLYCPGGTGVPVGLSGSESGVSYQLLVDDGTTTSPVGSPVAGTGSAVSFGNQTTVGTYSVQATNTTTGCVKTGGGTTVRVDNYIQATITSDAAPASQTVCQNGTPTDLSVSAIGNNLVYQWYSNPTNTTTGGTAVGINSTSYTPVTTASGTLYYYVTVTGPCRTVTSSVVSVTVTALTTITGNPSGAVYCQNATASALSVTASGSGTLTYQWYKNTTNSNTGGTSIGGATSSTYTPSTTTVGATYYYAVVSSPSCGSATSNTATVIVTTATTITSQPIGNSYCQNGTATALSVTASGTGTLTYQWYSNTANNNTTGAIIGGATSSTYTPSTTTAGTVYYYVIVSSPSCGSVTSNTATVVVNALPTVTASSNCTTTYGGSVTLTATATAGSGTITGYQWKLGGSPISGATSATYTTSITGSYTVTVTNSNGCSATSSTPVVIGAASGPLAGGTYTIGATGCNTFTTLSNALTYINTNGIASAVIFNVPAGYAETAPAASGFVLGSATLNATLNATNTLTFVKSGTGANPILTAAVGVSTPASAVPDGILSIQGADYVTIDGLTFTDGNTTNPATMEFGIGMFKTSVTDGTNNNTIQNCTFNMQRVNNATGTNPLADGSAAIGIYNSTATAAITALVPTATSGANSNNKIYTNTINGGNTGIDIWGYNNSTSPYSFTDQGNDVGGTSVTTGNTILNYGGGAATNPAVGIRTNGQYGLNVSYNTINNNNGSGVNHATTLRGIWTQTALGASETISNNIITLKGGGTTTQLSGIENTAGSTANGNTITITNNTIQNSTYSTGTTATFYGIFNSGSATTAEISNNKFQNNTFSGATTTGSLYAIYSTAVNTTTNCNNNQILNNIIGTSGSANSATFYGIYNLGASTNFNANSNTITGNSVANSYGSIYCIRGGTSIVTVDGNTISNNTIPNSAGATSSLIYGYYNGASPATESVTNNTISNLTITGSSTATAHTIYGIYNLTASGTKTFSGNNINTLTFTSSGAGYASVTGIRNAYSTTSNIFKNVIHSLSSTGITPSVSGIYLGSTTGTTYNIYNNLIGNLATPQSTGFNLTGIFCGSVGTNINLYYNTIYLNGTSTGTGFASSDIYQSSTTPSVLLNNNILVNLSTATGTGLTTAFRRTTSTLAQYNSASNNNLFYAGTPSANNLLFYDGTNSVQTMSAYKTLVSPRESNSFSETVSSTPGVFFQSLTGPSAGMPTTFLHLVNGLTTQAESGGTPISGISDDYDGNARNTTTPDVGADEFVGVSPAPIITNVTVPTSTCTATAHTINADVTTAVGTISSVVLNYNNGTTGSVTMTLASGNTYTGTIPAGTAGTTVTWSITATTSGGITKTYTGTSYKDAPLTGITITAAALPNPICAGSSTVLTGTINAAAVATYTAPPAVTNPTTDEDLGNITITQGATTILNNTTAINSLVGTIGTATGTAGSYSNFTAFGPYSITAGQTYNFSASTLQASFAYGNAIGIYIDYNHNGVFTDAGEAVYVSSATTSGAHTETGSFTVPASAVAGKTRIRIVVNEGLVTGPTMAVSYGEFEEYVLNIVPAFTYAWSNGTTTVGTTNPLTVTPTATTTYTLTATDANGCFITSSPLTVTVNPLPTAPTATNSIQCGTQVPTAFVADPNGFTTPTFKWYANNTTTTALQSSTSTTYTSSVSATTTFYVSVTNPGTGCESGRTAVTVTVTTPDPVTASATPAPICLGASTTLTATKTGTTNTYTYTWTSTSGSGIISGSNTGASLTVTPTAAGSYTYTVTAFDGTTNCTTTSTVNVTVNSLPLISSAIAAPSTICAGSSSVLTAKSVNANSGSATVGSGTTSGSTSGVSPYSGLWEGAKAQYLITASELTSAGFVSGNLTSLTFTITSAPTLALSNYRIGLKATALTTLTSSFQSTTGFTTVYGPQSYLPIVGANTHTFTTPFAWDGTSNIIVDVSFDNDPSNTCTGGSGVCYSSTASYTYTTTAFNSVTQTYADNVDGTRSMYNQTGLDLGTPAVTTTRPNIKFAGQLGTEQTSSYTWVWNPGNLSGSTVTVTPAATTTYTVTATNAATTCSSAPSTVTVTVNPLPIAPTATNSIQCGPGVPTAMVADPNGYTTPTFTWYSASTGGTVLQSGTSTTYMTSISATTTFYVSVKNPATGCESGRTSVTVTVNTPDAITASAAPSAICIGASTTLSVAQTGTTNVYTYTWTATSSNASTSGINGSVTGSSVVVTPTAAGSYTYQVSGYDATTQCTATSTVSVTVSALPTTPTITASATKVCSGTSVTLTASGSTSTSYCTPTYSSNDGSDYISKVAIQDATGTTTLFTRSSGATTPGYDNQTSLATTTLNAGATYKVTLTTGIYTGSENLAVFLDYNQDGIFSSGAETLLASTSVTGAGVTGTATFTVPATAYNGTARLRYVLTFSSAAVACPNNSFGEAEDYNVTIAGGITNPNNVTYLWSTGATTQSITVSPTATTSYTVTVTNSNGCTGTSAPTTVTVAAPLAGIYSIGSGNIAGEAGHYNTLTAAVADYNTLCTGGAVTFALTDATYSTAETFPIVINANSNASATNTLTIKPASGVTATISGSSTSSIIKLNGADYVTIDGSNSGGTDKNLTISNTSTAASTAAIWLSSLGANAGATNNVVKNTNISTGTTSSTTFGIALEGTALSTTGTGEDNDNVTIQNNAITIAAIGIYAAGTPANVNDNLFISGNTIIYTGGNVASTGIKVSQGLNGNISGNTVSASTSVSGTPVGISVETGFTSATLSKNIIGGITTSATGGYGGRGITIGTGTATSALTVSNNFVYGVNGSNYSSFGASSSLGIAIGVVGSSSTLTTTTGGVNLYNNSVSMTGSMGSGSTTAITTALYIGSGATALTIVDNIFSNTQTATSSTQKNYAVYSAATSTAYTDINYNDYYFANSGSTASAVLGYLTSDRATLAAWQTATGKDANSVNINPLFTSNTDLHISIGNGALDNLGTPVAGITTDIDNETRSTTTPDMGADEYAATACSGTSGGTIVYNGGVVCTSGSVTLTASGYPIGTSVTYQWEYSSSNTFASDVHDVTGQTSVPTATTGTITATTYFRLRSTCTVTSTIWYSNIVTVTVSSPSIVSTTAATRCGTGTATLQAAGSANTDINWYTTSTGGVPVATGTSFTTPVISSSTTYYAEAADASTVTDQAGKQSSTGANGSFITTAWGIVFNATQSVTLNSTIIYPTGTGTITLALLNSSGTELASTPAVTIAGGTGVSSPVLIPLGFTVPSGTGYRLVVKAYSGITNLIRDNAGLLYPYNSTSGAVTVPSSWNGSATTSAYYFFYNLVFSTGCKSARTAVTATVTPAPTVSINPASATVCAGSNITLTASSTNSGYTYTWTPGNATGATQTYAPAASTTYTVTATDNTTGTYGGCATIATAVVTADPAPTVVTITPASAAICAGTVQQLAATGGTYNAEAYTESFNSAAPAWTKTNTSTGGTPANADWTLRPNGYSYSVLYDDGFGDYFYEDYQFRNRDSSQFYLSNADAQGSSGVTHTTITSPSINTTSYQSLSLNFNQNFAPYTSADSAMVQVSTDGTNFTTVAKYTTRQGGETYVTYYYDGNFYEHDIYKETFATSSVDLSSYINQPNLYIRFKQDALYGFWWAVDSVALTGTHGSKIVWSPVAGLYTDASASTAYTAGTTATTVYAKPNATVTYTATAKNDISCTSSATTTITVNALPDATISASHNICAGSGSGVVISSVSGGMVYYHTSTAPTTVQSVLVPINGGVTLTDVPTVNTTYTLDSVKSSAGCITFLSAMSTVTLDAAPGITVAGTPNQSVCKNSAITAVTYTASGSASILTVSNYGNLTVDNNGTSTVTVHGSTATTVTYSVITTSSSVCSPDTITGTITVYPYITWTGASTANANWTTGANWCSGSAPLSTESVIIPLGTPHDPVLDVDITINGLTINTGATVNLNSKNFTTGAVSGGGKIIGSAPSTMTINASGTVNFDAASNTIHNLNINAGAAVILGSALNIAPGTAADPSIVTIANTATLNTGGLLTLKSDVNGTAAIGTNTSGNTYITGQVMVERYTDAAKTAGTPRRAWRLMTSPVTGITIHDAWQEGGTLATTYGTLITGEGLTSGGAASEGFDYIGGGNHTSIKQYDSASNAWVVLSTNITIGTNIPIRSHQAYMLFVRGNRSIGGSGASLANIRAKGTLLQGDQPVTIDTGFYTLVGNPYASTIDFGSIYTHNTGAIQDKFYLWNSHASSFGAYVLVDHLGNGKYEATPYPLTNPLTPPIVGDTFRYIPSGSGFLVSHVTGVKVPATLNISETDKASSAVPPVNPFRIVKTTNARELLVNLNVKDSDTSADLADGFRAKFSDDYVGNEEDNSSIKIANFNENLGLVRNGVNHIIEAREDVQKTDTLFMKMWYVTKRSYQLQMKGDNFTTAPGIQAWLVDSYLGTKQELNLQGNITTADFSVTSDSGSWKSDRFMIVFQNNSTVLPLTLTGVKAQPQNGGVQVSWTVTNEVNIKGYTIEKSTDGGQSYTSVGTQQAAKNNTGAAITTYNGFDAAPKVGDNLYRIRIEGKDGAVTYSSVVKVTIGESGTGIQITIYPNPVREGKVNLQMTNLAAGTYLVSMYTSGGGQTVYQKKISITQSGTTQSEQLILGGSIAQGSYQLRIADHTGTIVKETQLVVGR